MASSQASMIFSTMVSYFTVKNALLFLLAYIALSAIYQVIRYRFFHPLSKFPGPFWGSVTRLWFAYRNLIGDENDVCMELHKQYGKSSGLQYSLTVNGPVIRITPTLLLVSDATRLPEMYHRQANKSLHYITGSFGAVESVFNMLDWRQHAHYRKLIAAPYSFTNLKKMEPLVDERVHHWIKRMDELFTQTGEKLDFGLWAIYIAYDVVSELGFGAPFGFVESGSDVGGLIKGIRDGMPLFGLLGRLYTVTALLKKTWIGKKYLVVKPEDQNGVGVLMRFRDRLFEQRLRDIEAGTTQGRFDLIHTFLDARTEDGKPLDEEYVKAEMLIIMLAGADTTGTAIQSLIHNILADETVYSKIMTEIDAATRAGQLSSMPQYHEVQKSCPYYSACVRETLRLYPSGPTVFPRLVSKGGMVFDGKFAPEGTEVAANPWHANRDENVYGKDATVFRPERWLESEEKIAKYKKYDLTFGYGARGCLGRDLALMELYKTPVQFLRTFRFQPVEQGKIGTWAVTGGVAHWDNMWLSLERRAPVV